MVNNTTSYHIKFRFGATPRSFGVTHSRGALCSLLGCSNALPSVTNYPFSASLGDLFLAEFEPNLRQGGGGRDRSRFLGHPVLREPEPDVAGEPIVAAHF